ncbi:MAG: hypothetical protein MJ056_07455, partial [Akkermansia sp.]|nr:hypothetical protein [Akkermansia sp.]
MRNLQEKSGRFPAFYDTHAEKCRMRTFFQKKPAFGGFPAYMGGWLRMGLPGAIYALGTGQAWIAIGLGIGTILNWVLIAKPL